MNVKVYAKSVQGATHLRNAVVCQDSCYWSKKAENAVIMAIADGHGSEKCPYSDEGAYRAVHAFCDIMQEVLDGLDGDMTSLKPLIDDNRLLAKKISALWRKRVLRKHNDEHREKIDLEVLEEVKRRTSIRAALHKANQTKIDYMLYGTTLLGVAIFGEFALVYQIGDGDIQLITEEGVKPLVDADKFLGVETYSLAHDMSWNYAKTTIVSLDDLKKPFLIMMSTDGLSNSYINDIEFAKCCKDYFDIIKEEGFETVRKELKDWLRDTSDHGCGDDITVGLAYFEE